MRFPEWMPAPLKEAYEMACRIPDAQWARNQDRERQVLCFSRHTEIEASDYLIGIGTKAETLEIARKIGSAVAMREVWARLSALESDIRSERISGGRFVLGQEIVSCSIVARCAIYFTERSITRHEWKRVYGEIATAAAELARLLRKIGSNSMFPSLDVLYIGREILEIASDVDFHSRLCHEHSNLTKNEAEQEEDLQPLTAEQIEADAAENREKAKPTARSIVKAMRSSSVKPEKLVSRIELIARSCASEPPFLPQEEDLVRNRVFSVTIDLGNYFHNHFGRWLDAEVATIASAITDEVVTADSVKQRRRRSARNAERMGIMIDQQYEKMKSIM